MDRTSSLSPFAAAVAFCFILGGAACSVPLAPGYRIVKQSREVRFVPAQAPELRVSTNYTLENSGTTDLTFADMNFPPEKRYGRKDLRVEVDGKETNPTQLPEEYQFSSPNTLRIPLQPVWKLRENRELAVEYAFSSPADSGARITLGQDNFHLSSRGWTSLPQPPRHVLSPYPGRPPRTTYSVRVPSNFLVLARGTLTGRKQEGAEAVYRFELRKEDLTPFVVAGHYVASAPESKKKSTAIFWTFQPLKENAGAASERISAAWDVLEKDFGPLDEDIRVPHIVESTDLTSDPTEQPGPAAAAAFPGGALVDAQALALGIASEEFLERVTHALAHNWFGDEVFFAPYAAIGMGEGLPEYATIVVEEAQKGPSGRRQRVIQYLNVYDEASKDVEEETPLGSTAMTDPPAQRRLALAKAPLFFVAIEDACGEAPMRSGLKQMVTLLRGQETSYSALRSALEQSCGKNLAELFRVWLNDKGVPSDFRARYGR